jgi:tRNA pseudouridine55 synthase
MILIQLHYFWLPSTLAHDREHSIACVQRPPTLANTKAKTQNRFMVGILIVDKPAGLTSHDVVARVRRTLGEKRVGHTGTLDPFATGVLVVLVGRATRLAQFLSGAEKEYEGVIRFGFATDTGDATGTARPETRAALSSREFAESWDESKIEDALSSFRGSFEQIPPMYSAKKVLGKKLYELARKGREIERAAVPVTVSEFEAQQLNGSFLQHNTDGTCDLAVRVVCSAGTYIRTLAESVGERFGVAAHLCSLRRTRAGDFKISQAQTLAELEQLAQTKDDVESVLVPLRTALSGMTSAILDDEYAGRVRHGATVPSDVRWPDGELVQLCDPNGELIAIGVYSQEQRALRPRVVLI